MTDYKLENMQSSTTWKIVNNKCIRRSLPLLVLALTMLSGTALGSVLPKEPVEIGNTPQFLFDMYIVDNHWPVRPQDPPARLVFHAPEKHPANPVLRAPARSYAHVIRDEDGLFRMYCQVVNDQWREHRDRGIAVPKTAIGYAESEDGVEWTVPNLGIHEWQGNKNNSIVWRGHQSNRGAGGGVILDVPEKDRRGYRYLMLAKSGGAMELVGSHDGLQWEYVDTIIEGLASDTYNTIVYDEQRDEYVWFGRAKHSAGTHYRGGGTQTEWLEGGASRRVARMSSPALWEWEGTPQNILVPDNHDADAGFNYFYGMPVRYYAGVYWGFLWPFKRNTEIYTELAVSRDGLHWQRMPGRPWLLEFGEKDEREWDSWMIFAGPSSWLEVDGEWWIYYSGYDGPHGKPEERTSGIGLATVRKEGFYSLRGPSSGAVVATRSMRWPGGQLVVNADTTSVGAGGELKVRVLDEQRNEIEGFGYADCIPFHGDSTSHVVAWRGGTADQLRGRTVRFDFLLRDADLFTFRADPDAEPPSEEAWPR